MASEAEAVGSLAGHARAWPLVGWLLASLWWLLPLDSELAQPWTDQQLRWLAPTQAPAGVLVLNIDEPSLTALQPLVGNWPFGRDVHASVVRWLRERGVAVIALDLVLADTMAGDAALAAELASPGAPLLLAAAGQMHTSPLASPYTAPTPSVPAHSWASMTLPPPGLLGSTHVAGRLGVITTPLDRDGVLRSLPLWHGAPGLEGALPVMPWAVLQALEAAKPGHSHAASNNAAPPLPAGVKLDRRGHVALALGAPWAMATTFPYAEAARAALGASPDPAWASALSGQVVFIGSTVLLADRVMTAWGQREGTVLLAEAFAALRDGQTLAPRQRAWEALLLILAAVPAVLAARRGAASVRRDIAASAAVALLMALAVAAALAWARLGTPTLSPVLALLLAGLGSVAWRQASLKAAADHAAYEQAVASAAERTKAEFLANVSHEIRTPLNGLLGVAELLERTPLNDEQRRHVALFRDSGRSLQALIDDLLDISKIEAGGFMLHEAPFALRPLLDQVLRLMRPRADSKGLTFEVVCEESLPTVVQGDRQRLEQILLNLVGNAIKFTSGGGVRVTARESGSGGLELEVQDTGIGIAPSKHERVFEPFAQADGSITRHYGGTGLGLAIVRRLVKLMGGTIALDSAPGRGSTFTLRLPLREVAAMTANTEVTAPGTAGTTTPPSPMVCRVLLAEDNEVNVYIFTAMLTAPEFDVQVADNGLLALELARGGGYDIAFIDLMMPAMDGLTLARELRDWEAEGGRARMPLVALTARAFDSDIAHCLEAGFDRHVRKPFGRDALLTTVAELARPRVVPRSSAPFPNGLDSRGVADPRRGHARHFLLHIEAEHGAARANADIDHARALLNDLVEAARVIGDPELAEAAGLALAEPQAPMPPTLRQALSRAIVAQADPFGST